MTEDGPSLERLRAQLAGGVPPELDQWIATPREDTPYHQGSLVPVVGWRETRLPSGLWVVGDPGTPPAPIDQFATYLTASQVFGSPLEAELLDSLLGDATARRLVWAAAWLLWARHEGGNAIDETLVNALLVGDAREHARHLLSADGVLVVPQLQLLVAAGGLMGLPWTKADDVDEPAFEATLLLGLHVGDLLEHASKADSGGDDEVLFGNVRAELAADVVANQLHNSAWPLRADIARHEALWHRHVTAVAESTGLPDLHQVFQEATGVSLDVFEAVGFGLYAARGQPPFVSRSWFTPTSISDDQVAAVDDLVAVSPDALRARLEEDLEGDLAGNRWNLSAFSQWPLLRFDDDRWLVFSRQLLVDRFFSGLAFFDAWFGSGDQRARVWHAWGLVTESYGHEVLSSVAADRVYSEKALEAGYGGPGRRIADAAVDYGDEWLVLDFSSRRPAQELARGANPEGLKAEIRVLIDEKGAQLQSTINAIRDDERALTAATQMAEHRTFTPVIVVHSRWPINPVTYELVQQRLADLGLLQDSDVHPLEIVTIEELEMVEGIQHEGGPNFCELLGQKRDGPLFRMGLRDHVLRVARLEPPLSRRLQEDFDACFDRMVNTYGFPEGHD